MKKLVIIPLLCVIMSCGSRTKDSKAANTAIKADSGKKISASDSEKKPAAKDSLSAKLKKEDLREKLVGIWADTSGNPLFQIDKKTFFYPDNEGRYPYKVIGDSIQIRYDGGPQSFSWKFKGDNILIMNGHDGLMILHRVKE